MSFFGEIGKTPKNMILIGKNVWRYTPFWAPPRGRSCNY
jgi:hypothetical protein